MTTTAVFVTVLVVAVVAIAVLAGCFIKIRRMPEGSEEMKNLAKIIRDGAAVFMRTEYKVIVPVVVGFALVFSLFVEKFSGFTFILGALMSSLACVIGMRGATYANVRVTNTALSTKNLGKTTRTALIGGSISGLAVQGFGLLGLTILLLIMGGINPEATSSGLILGLPCNATLARITNYSLGCSVVAMFNRVAGGNYTKAADISADNVAKVRHRLPEDDPRIPNVIADFIGDNVNDIAGNCSDLLESFVATISASLLIAQFVCQAVGSFAYLNSLVSYTLLLAGGGLLACVLCLGITMLRTPSNKPSKELDLLSTVSAVITVGLSLMAGYHLFGHSGQLLPEFRLGWVSPCVASLMGIISGIAIGKLTEFYTATEYKPVQKLAQSATEGAAFVITKGDALGSRSVLLPVLTIGVALFLANLACGPFGIAAAALGMLSFVAATVSVDAFGPIADNAGGIAESCHLDPEVRNITDRLDAVGNTTAAIGKGFAIGSAAFATVSLILSYVHSYSAGDPILNAASPRVIIGLLIGGALVEFFSAVLTDNTIDSATKMADEGDRQLRGGILDGTKKPDYNRCIAMATEEALRKMSFPSLLALMIPVVAGLLFGPEMVGGLLVGSTIVAITRALFMGNSGGAFDNGKKAIEAGMIRGHGKGSEAHVAAVVGDTVGDTRKDVVGVALDIFIKTMGTVANTTASVFSAFHLM